MHRCTLSELENNRIVGAAQRRTRMLRVALSGYEWKVVISKSSLMDLEQSFRNHEDDQDKVIPNWYFFIKIVYLRESLEYGIGTLEIK